MVARLDFSGTDPLARQEKWQDAGKYVRSLFPLSFFPTLAEIWYRSVCFHSGNEQIAKGSGMVPRYSLRMELVQSPIHSNGDLQALHTLVFSLLLYNSSQSCPTELGSSFWNSSTHLFHNDAVFTCAVQAQLLQNSPDLEESEPVTAQKETQGIRKSFGSMQMEVLQLRFKGNGTTSSALTPSNCFQVDSNLNSEWRPAPGMPFVMLDCISRRHKQ